MIQKLKSNLYEISLTAREHFYEVFWKISNHKKINSYHKVCQSVEKHLQNYSLIFVQTPGVFPMITKQQHSLFIKLMLAELKNRNIQFRSSAPIISLLDFSNRMYDELLKKLEIQEKQQKEIISIIEILVKKLAHTKVPIWLQKSLSDSTKKVRFVVSDYHSPEFISYLAKQTGLPSEQFIFETEAIHPEEDHRIWIKTLHSKKPSDLKKEGDILRLTATLTLNTDYNSFYALINSQKLTLGGQLCQALSERYITNESKYNTSEFTLKSIGYQLIGPMHLMYVFWMLQRAKEQKLDRIYFLARDGYYLDKTLEKINAKLKSGIKGTYTFASRRLFFLPTIYSLTPRVLNMLVSADQALQLSDFLHRINLDPAKYKTKLSQLGFKNSEQILTDWNGRFLTENSQKSLISFFKSIENDLLNQCEQERKILLDYYKSIGLNKKGAAIVDVGWNASSAGSIAKIFNREKWPLPKAWYFGTWEKAAKHQQEGIHIDSFFMHFSQPRNRRRIVQNSIALLELFFTAPHPGIAKLKQTENGFQPEYIHKKLPAQNKEIVNLLFEGSMQFIDAYLSIPGVQPEIDIHYLQVILKKVLHHPEKKQAEALGAYLHNISFGNVSQLFPLAAVGQTGFSKKDLLTHTLWKAGLKKLLK